ncbi:hypothetical protein [Nocardia brasiliensis]|uniref:hypothetical protein n=1 Tax=Nocardia brasiliensis TaxID=37326 RepID=UPI002456218E|nr:hypothetical protein [Nocardia brasiliensis]
MTGETEFALEMVHEVEEEPVRLPALAKGTLEHCAAHLETCADIFHNARNRMYWFDNHTFTVELPTGWFLFRVVTRPEAEAPSSRCELVGKGVSVDSIFREGVGENGPHRSVPEIHTGVDWGAPPPETTNHDSTE